MYADPIPIPCFPINGEIDLETAEVHFRNRKKLALTKAYKSPGLNYRFEITAPALNTEEPLVSDRTSHQPITEIIQSYWARKLRMISV